MRSGRSFCRGTRTDAPVSKGRNRACDDRRAATTRIRARCKPKRSACDAIRRRAASRGSRVHRPAQSCTISPPMARSLVPENDDPVATVVQQDRTRGRTFFDQRIVATKNCLKVFGTETAGRQYCCNQRTDIRRPRDFTEAGAKPLIVKPLATVSFFP